MDDECRVYNHRNSYNADFNLRKIKTQAVGTIPINETLLSRAKFPLLGAFVILAVPHSRKESCNKSKLVVTEDDTKRFAVHILCKRLRKLIDNFILLSIIELGGGVHL